MIGKVLGKARELIRKAAQRGCQGAGAFAKAGGQSAATKQLKEKARESVLAKLELGKAEVAKRLAERRAAQSKPK